MRYRVFVRNQWRWDPSRFSDYRTLVPDPKARKRTIGYAKDEEEAKALCRAYNGWHPPGELGRKAEYVQVD